MRTGVTAVLPRDEAGNPQPVWAGQFTLNGNGEMTGTHWIDDAGHLIGPICITNTHAIGAVHHGATQRMIDHYADFFESHRGWAMPVVAETYDGMLTGINALHVTPAHAIAAITSAKGGPVEEGSAGGGNGKIAYEFKAGTGTASRQVRLAGQNYRVGALVQANHGLRDWLTILGKPVGKLMTEDTWRKKRSRFDHCADRHRCAAVRPVAAPHRQTRRRRHRSRRHLVRQFLRRHLPGLLGRQPRPHAPRGAAFRDLHRPQQRSTGPIYLASVEAVEEAAVNAIVAGVDVASVKPEGIMVRAIDTAKLAALFRHA